LFRRMKETRRQIGPVPPVVFGYPAEILFCCTIHRIMDALAYLQSFSAACKVLT
jgi:hypothetical protein